MPKKSIIHDSQEDLIRINKYLSDAGVCSRREADRLIESGKVIVDGKKATMGLRINKNQTVICNGRKVQGHDKLVLIAFNKPVGIECTSDKKNPDNIIDFIHYPTRIYTIGRLDKNSEGLILLTNDGDIVNKISKSGNNHEKEYLVRVNKPITKDFIKAMSDGVRIMDKVTKKCKVTQEGKYEFRIVLTQGLNRQIRRMCEALDYRVLALKRVRVMNIRIGRLKTGTYRNVTPDELKELFELIKDSSN